MYIHPATPWQGRGLCRRLLSAWLLLSLLPCLSLAQVPSHITSDGSTGTIVTSHGSVDGSVYNIDGGTLHGPNQFHSFDQFSVGTGDTASFHGPAGIENIISRVTGGSRSDIDGTLQSTIDGANLFLLNPVGIMFGPDATLDVNGSFHASTADELRFADGGSFKVDLSGGNRLTMAAPVVFGFLGANPSGIVVTESELAVGRDETLSLVGGDLDIVGGTLVANSGRVNLVSVASRGEVALPMAGEETALDMGSFSRLGDIAMRDDAMVDVSGAGAGTIVIRSGELVVDNSRLLAETTGNQDGAAVGIDVEAMGDVILTNETRISSTTGGAGDAGDVMITTGDLTLTDGSRIRSTTSGSGQGGTVTVRAADVTLDGSSGVSEIRTHTLEERGGGDAGAILIEAEHLRLLGTARIISETLGSGQGGNVTVRVTDVTLEGTTPNNGSSGVFTTTINISRLPPFLERQFGDAGAILIEADHVRVLGGARISSTTRSNGQGGNVTVRATDVTLEGTTPNNGSSGIFANPLVLVLSFGRDVERQRIGDAGAILIEAEHLRVLGGAQISSTTRTSGQAGRVTVRATDVTLEGAAPDNGPLSGIFANAAEAGREPVMLVRFSLRLSTYVF